MYIHFVYWFVFRVIERASLRISESTQMNAAFSLPYSIKLTVNKTWKFYAEPISRYRKYLNTMVNSFFLDRYHIYEFYYSPL